MIARDSYRFVVIMLQKKTLFLSNLVLLKTFRFCYNEEQQDTGVSDVRKISR